MALEAIKHITQFGAYDTGGGFQWGPLPALTPTLLLYSAFEKAPFRTTYLMKQRKDCAVCSSNPSVTRQSLQSGSMDYEVFCGLRAPINLLPDHRRISAQTFNDQVRSGSECITLDEESPRDFSSNNPYVLIDVREAQDFDMCRIAGSVNLPFSHIEKAKRDLGNRDDVRDGISETDVLWKVEGMLRDEPDVGIYFICRYGNDSQMAVRYFMDLLDEDSASSVLKVRGDTMMDIEGGLRAWSKVDPTFPEY